MIAPFEPTTDSRVCMQIVMQYNTPYYAWTYCRSIGGRLCSYNDFMQMCASYTVYANYTAGFYQDHAVNQGYYRQWSSNVCDPIFTNINGGLPQTTMSNFRCCK